MEYEGCYGTLVVRGVCNWRGMAEVSKEYIKSFISTRGEAKLRYVGTYSVRDDVPHHPPLPRFSEPVWPLLAQESSLSHS